MKYSKYLRFIWLRALAELKADVRTSHMGVAWWVLDPIIYMGVFYVVFGLGLRQGGDGFVVFLLLGLVVWRWFDSSVKKAGSVLLAYKTLLSQVYIPKIVLPLIPIISNTIRFSIVYLLFLLCLAFISSSGFHYWVWLPVLLAAQLLFLVGFGLLMSAVIPFIPDIRRLLDYGVSLLFFMSGIFYSIDKFDGIIYKIFMLNPMAYFIHANRAVLLYEKSPELTYLSIHVSVSAAMLFLACLIYRRFDKTYPLIVQ